MPSKCSLRYNTQTEVTGEAAKTKLLEEKQIRVQFYIRPKLMQKLTKSLVRLGVGITR